MVAIFMHPNVLLHQFPIAMGLSRAGMHVVSCGSRWPNNDSTLIMEKVVEPYTLSSVYEEFSSSNFRRGAKKAHAFARTLGV